MGELIGIARFRFHDGKVDDYKRLSAAAMEIVRTKEPGTLDYSIYFNEDETEAVVIERFASPEALLQHGANMAEISAEVMKNGALEGELIGEPGPVIRANLTGPEPQLFLPWMTLREG
jgi:quinol monooxygenase YgiN